MIVAQCRHSFSTQSWTSTGYVYHFGWRDFGPMPVVSAQCQHPDSGWYWLSVSILVSVIVAQCRQFWQPDSCQCIWADSGVSFIPCPCRVWQPQPGRVISSGLLDLGHHRAEPFWLPGIVFNPALFRVYKLVSVFSRCNVL